MSDYLLANHEAAVADRFDALSAIFDPVTFRHLAAAGVTAGWRCWEVGAGGSSVVRWLAERVGPTGRVLATDLDVSRIDAPNVDKRIHDIGRDPPPAETFDLVHARLVLVHVVDREAALRAMIGALRPGGWLVIEDADPALQPLACLDAHGPDQALANRLKTQFRALLVERGVDLAYGRNLPRLLRTAGLDDVGADGYFAITSPACIALEQATIAQVRDRLIASGRATVDDIERHLANLAAGRIDPATSPLISAWGRARQVPQAK